MKGKQWALKRIDDYLNFEGIESSKYPLEYAVDIINEMDEVDPDEIISLKKEIETQRKAVDKLKEESVTHFQTVDDLALSQAVAEGEIELNDVKYKLTKIEPMWVVAKKTAFVSYFKEFMIFNKNPFYSKGTYVKKDAYHFTDKEKAEAVATLIDGEVAEYETD